MLASGIISAVFLNVFIGIAIGVALFFLLGGRRAFIVFFIIGMIYVPIVTRIYDGSKADALQNALIEGTVDSIVIENADNFSFYIKNLKVNDESYPRKAFVTVTKDESGVIKQGDYVTFIGNLSKYYLNPKESYSVSDYNKGYYYRAECTFGMTVSEKFSFVPAFKQKVYQNLYWAMSENNAAIAYALIFGDTSEISPEAKSVYKAVGIMHVFAVSGLHFAFLFSLLNFLFKKLGLKKQPHKSIAIFIIFIFFAYLCGFSPSALRAVTMITIYMYASSSGRKYDIMNVLCFAAVVLLLINPLYLFDVGFLLSFFAVFGIALFDRKAINFLVRIKGKIKGKQNAPKAPNAPEPPPQKVGFVIKSVAMTFAANVGAFPFLCIYFGGVPLITFVANIVVVPLISVLFPFILLMSAAGTLLRPLNAVLIIADVLISGINYFLTFIAQTPLYVGVNFNVYTALLYYAVIIYLSDYYIGKRFKVLNRH
jgi:competence protein ComEC